MLAGDHVSNFNKNCVRNYHPLYYICMYESMTRWCGIGGRWINAGLPQYIAIDINPENGCEIHNADNGVSCIMMQVNLVNN